MKSMRHRKTPLRPLNLLLLLHKQKTPNISYNTKQRIIFIIHTYTQSNCFTYYQAKIHPNEYSIVQTYY